MRLEVRFDEVSAIFAYVTNDAYLSVNNGNLPGPPLASRPGIAKMHGSRPSLRS
jgi:hypothetical protein